FLALDKHRGGRPRADYCRGDPVPNYWFGRYGNVWCGEWDSHRESEDERIPGGQAALKLAEVPLEPLVLIRPILQSVGYNSSTAAAIAFAWQLPRLFRL